MISSYVRLQESLFQFIKLDARSAKTQYLKPFILPKINLNLLTHHVCSETEGNTC